MPFGAGHLPSLNPSSERPNESILKSLPVLTANEPRILSLRSIFQVSVEMDEKTGLLSLSGGLSKSSESSLSHAIPSVPQPRAAAQPGCVQRRTAVSHEPHLKEGVVLDFLCPLGARTQPLLGVLAK